MAPGHVRRQWLLVALAGLLGALLIGCAAPAGTVAAPPTPTGGTQANGAQANGAQAAGCPAPARDAPGAGTSRLPVRSLCALPGEAATVWHTIETGGKPAYPRDGIVFNNNERVLPQQKRGYYHEYTVPTPGERDRGARRLVTGQSRELYYTADHYASFVVVDPTAVSRN
jgi:ribonuclease T1